MKEGKADSRQQMSLLNGIFESVYYVFSCKRTFDTVRVITKLVSDNMRFVVTVCAKNNHFKACNDNEIGLGRSPLAEIFHVINFFAQ